MQILQKTEGSGIGFCGSWYFVFMFYSGYVLRLMQRSFFFEQAWMSPGNLLHYCPELYTGLQSLSTKGIIW
jgi:hypothetical protein